MVCAFLPSLAGLFEWVRTWFWTGFPWYSPSDAVFDMGLSSLLPIGGYLGVSFVFYLLSGLLVYTILNSKNRKTYMISTSILGLLFLVLFATK
ncbi:hypothetical protein [Isorropodon fossajaponicum symbiont]|uniref:hypothetical protein n=1 Tax=Isorropodon fossajaponicum symbiont TaxID=883811 RepID=UPI003CC997D9